MKSEYKVIKGVGSGRGRLQVGLRVRLFQGPDHLLLVQSTGYTEEYKRVFYRDVRYVVARQNYGQQRQAMLSAALFLLICLLFLTSMPKVMVTIFALPFLIWFIVNFALGPTCRTYINTDVQTIEVPAPRRMRKVSKMIHFLNSKIPTDQPRVEPAVA